MERSISISELSAENGVAPVNAYELIIRDNEDRFGIQKADLTCCFANIDLN